MSLELRPFTKEEWNGFEGAERFENGREPLIGKIYVYPYDATIVVDKNGVNIYFESDDECYTYSYFCKDKNILSRWVTALKKHFRRQSFITTECLVNRFFMKQDNKLS